MPRERRGRQSSQHRRQHSPGQKKPEPEHFFIGCDSDDDGFFDCESADDPFALDEEEEIIDSFIATFQCLEMGGDYTEMQAATDFSDKEKTYELLDGNIITAETAETELAPEEVVVSCSTQTETSLLNLYIYEPSMYATSSLHSLCVGEAQTEVSMCTHLLVRSDEVQACEWFSLPRPEKPPSHASANMKKPKKQKGKKPPKPLESHEPDDANKVVHAALELVDEFKRHGISNKEDESCFNLPRPPEPRPPEQPPCQQVDTESTAFADKKKPKQKRRKKPPKPLTSDEPDGANTFVHAAPPEMVDKLKRHAISLNVIRYRFEQLLAQGATDDFANLAGELVALESDYLELASSVPNDKFWSSWSARLADDFITITALTQMINEHAS